MTPDDQQAEQQRRGIVAGVTAYLIWGALTLYCVISKRSTLSS